MNNILAEKMDQLETWGVLAKPEKLGVSVEYLSCHSIAFWLIQIITKLLLHIMSSIPALSLTVTDTNI